MSLNWFTRAAFILLSLRCWDVMCEVGIRCERRVKTIFLLLLALLNLTINLLSVTCLLIERLLGFIGFVNSGNWPCRVRNAQFLSYHLFFMRNSLLWLFFSISLTHSPLTFYSQSIFTFAQKARYVIEYAVTLQQITSGFFIF